jgi:hypothetical protein
LCQRLYIASRTKLRAVQRSKTAPFLSVRDAADNARARARFHPGREFLYLAGAHVECGCGFPAVPAAGDKPDATVDAADLKSMGALADHLRDACRRHSTVQLYLCWVHEEPEAPLTQRTVTLDDLRDPGFRLRHREILTVGRAP